MHKHDFKRAVVGILIQRIFEPRRFIQVITGPRQVGKTTAVQQMLAEWSGPSHYATADAPAPPQPIWIEQQWQIARLRYNSNQAVNRISGLTVFQREFSNARTLWVGQDGIPVEEFLMQPATHWFQQLTG
jgi:hypothetical protein